VQKDISWEIRKKTWPKSKPPVALLAKNGTTEEVDVTKFLLMSGYCTVPSHASRYSLNTLWAWVRYFGAFSNDPSLSLNADFEDLDPHQKTILSDDFGMGMSMHLLADTLSLVGFCDGKYFIDRLQTRIPCKVSPKTSKRGPRKSPDFVAVDKFGKVHVIECKGTQTGRGYALTQLKNAIAQKQTIDIQGNIKGESLATAFVISGDQKDWKSSFIVADPEAEDPLLVVGPASKNAVLETLARGKKSRCLSLIGANSFSRTVSAPFGISPEETWSSEQNDDYLAFEAARQERALMEIDALQKLGGKFRGRRAVIDLPFSINVGGKTFSKVEVTSGVKKDFVDEWAEPIRAQNARRSSSEDSLGDKSIKSLISKIKIEADGSGGVLTDGKHYRSEVLFLS
jgi:hypothetical protein